MAQNSIRGYEVHETLGQGGFGAVYRAYQAILKRDVALKVILPQYANEASFIRRFEREAEIVAQLEHPHIVPLFDYWRDSSGAYLVMRLIRGGSLAEKVQQGTLNLESAAAIFEQICNALYLAHRHQIVHRDIKPANILLDEDGNAYLTDFGIALSPSYQTQSEQGIAGTLYYAAPEQIQGGEISPKSDIYALGVVLYELLAGSNPFAQLPRHELFSKLLYEPLPDIGGLRPELPPAVNAIIQQATAKDPAERFADMRELSAALLDGIRGEITIKVPEKPEEAAALDLPNPYKGLRAFQEYDRQDFFGREALIDQLLQRMSEPKERFLAVIGPSGSGKSSVVKAGLLPRLREGALKGSENWFIVEIFPGSSPFAELEAGLLRVAVNPPSSLLEQLTGPDGISRAIKRILPDDESELLLLIDQFEELFTLVEDETLRTAFIERLLDALSNARSRLRLIVTLRADFYDRPMMYEHLGQLILRRQLGVLPLSNQELESAIVQPAAQLGVGYETGLVDAILQEVKEQPGILPLLQYALTELFEKRKGAKLALEAHAAIGGVTGALSKRAEEIYTALGGAEQASARQLFLRLVTLGEGTEDTRRRVRRSELEGIAGLDAVLEAFGESRLLRFDRDSGNREPTVEVAHEALIRSWERLREWLNNSREEVRLHRRLTLSAAEWKTANEDPSFLATGTRLDAFASWAEATELSLNKDEKGYLQESLENQAEQRKREEARKAHEAQIARRVQNFQRASIGLGVMVFLTVIATGSAIFAFVGANNRMNEVGTEVANGEARIESLRLAALSQDEIDSNAEIAAMLGIQALYRSDTAPAYNALQVASDRLYGLAILKGHTNAINGAIELSDGRLLSWSWDKTLRLWDSTGQSLATLEGHTSAVRSAIELRDGRLLSWGNENTLRLWDSSGQPLASLEGHSSWVVGATELRDGRLLSWSNDPSLRLWDSTGQPLATLDGHTSFVWGAIELSDGRLLSWSSDNTLRLWDSAGQPLAVLEGHTSTVDGAIELSDGRLLSWSS
jgi:serine/threonine protein kinase